MCLEDQQEEKPQYGELQLSLIPHCDMADSTAFCLPLCSPIWTWHYSFISAVGCVSPLNPDCLTVCSKQTQLLPSGWDGLTNPFIPCISTSPFSKTS